MPPKAPAAKLPTKNGNLMPVGFNADPSTTAVTVTLSNDAVPLFTRGKNTKKDLPFLSAVVVPAVIGLCAKAQDANIRVRTTDHRAFITTVRLNVEQNQLVNVFGEFCVCVGSLKSA